MHSMRAVKPEEIGIGQSQRAANQKYSILDFVMKNLKKNYRAVVFGGTGGIGAALVKRLKQDGNCSRVISVSRTTHPSFNLEKEDDLKKIGDQIKEHAPFQLMIDASGALTIDGIPPEKKLQDATAANLQKHFLINATGPLLLLKHVLESLDVSSRAVYAKLSARVGSISDNRLGGWYAYRASKTALNMLVQNAAIESHRTRKLGVFALLQPGTVFTPLSEKFVSAEKSLSPEFSAEKMLTVLDNLPSQPSAHFIDYLGKPISW